LKRSRRIRLGGLAGTTWESRISVAMRQVESVRLPVVVELSGMPKLGKTLFADALTDLFRQAGCSVARSPDATAEFPISDRWRVEFSAWGLVATVKHFLEMKESGCQALVVDRGVFDAVAWLRLKVELGLCDQDTFCRLAGLAYSQPWWSHHFLVLVFVAASEQVLQRASQRRLYRGQSPVTTARSLDRLRSALRRELQAHDGEWPEVREFEVSDMSVTQVLHAGAEAVVSGLERYAATE
jgi:hypothetical protein